jgi:multiple sugar transport system ATP-binding protein
MATVTLRAVRKSFGPTAILHGIDLDVAEGEFVVFVGPSGCGKSTLLRLVCGLDEVTSGTLAIDGEIVNDVPPAKRGIAMVFQSYALYPHMTVAQNMGYALRLADTPRPEIDARVRAAADVLRLGPLLERKPRQLSGGQRQRVAIGRAIVREPRLFLFDEPLSNLDAALRIDMRAEIARLKARLGTTMIYVTHDQTEAMTLADKIVVLNAGRIEQVGSPLDLYRRPANRFVAGFIGSPRMNMLPARVGERGTLRIADRVDLTVPLAAKPGETVEVGIRAEHLAAGRPDAVTLPGSVAMIERLGADTFAHATVEGVADPVIVRLGGEAELRVGDPVALGLDLDRLHVFSGAGLRLDPLPAERNAA